MQKAHTIESLPALCKTLGLIGDEGLPGATREVSEQEFEKAAITAVRERVEEHREAFRELKADAEFSRMLHASKKGHVDGYDLVRESDRALRAVARYDFELGVVSGNQSALLPKQGGCFSRACFHVGVDVDSWAKRVIDLSDEDASQLALLDVCKVHYVKYSSDDPRNHVQMVSKSCKTGQLHIQVDGGDGSQDCVVAVTSMQEFFNKTGSVATTKFYSDDPTVSRPLTADEPGPSGFGSGASTAGQPTSGFGAGLPGFGGFDRSRPPPRDESVHDETARSGGSNLGGGVTRSRKRVIKATSAVRTGQYTAKNYNTSGVTMFNNIDELFLDTISRDFAQEIIDELFSAWGLPTDEPGPMAYAEDLLWLFLIARTASNKADYNAQFEVPCRKGTITVDFRVFSLLLSDTHGVTRRNFARGVSDDLRAYLQREGNQFIVARIAQRVGADPQMGTLCFDGSTGCTGLTTSELTFTKVLEARNLFERDDVIAEGASNRLFQGMSGGVRSVVPR